MKYISKMSDDEFYSLLEAEDLKPNQKKTSE